jgi:hypothetical protein
MGTYESCRVCREGLNEVCSACWSERIWEIEHTLAIAGPKPFHKAPTPSCAIVLRAQSMNPLYIPWGADWSRDLMTCNPILISHQVMGRGEKMANVGRDGNSPHCDACRSSCQDDGSEVQLRRVGACWCESSLCKFICSEIPIFERKHENGKVTTTSRNMKGDTYAALPGPSLARVAPVPRKILLKPPSL